MTASQYGREILRLLILGLTFPAWFVGIVLCWAWALVYWFVVDPFLRGWRS